MAKKSFLIVLIVSMFASIMASSIQINLDKNTLGLEIRPLEKATLPNINVIKLKLVIPPQTIVGDLKISNQEVIKQSKFIPIYEGEKTFTESSGNSLDFIASKQARIGEWQASYHYKNGIKLAIVTINHQSYKQSEKLLTSIESGLIEIQLTASNEAYKDNYLISPNIEDVVGKDLIIFPESEDIYRDLYNSRHSFARNSLNENNAKMLIFSPTELVSTWSSYKTFKESQGLSTTVIDLDDVYAIYSGRDNAEKLRNCIIDFYDDIVAEENRLEYVLIGGDYGSAPTRILRINAYYNSSLHSDNIYSDQYFAGLDGDWDNDGDNIFGEGDNSLDSDATGSLGDEADLLSEVAVGRIPVETEQELLNWIAKQEDYSLLNVEDNFYEKALMIGEHLGGSTYGGPAMDEVAGIMDNYAIETLYQLEGDYTSANVINNFNSGYSIINHLGHGGYSHIFNITSEIIDNDLTNTDYPLIYSQGCHSAKINYNDSIAELLIIDEHGAFAYIGNTSYGFYSSFQNQGTSQLFHREFYDGLANENIDIIGRTFNDSKEDLISIVEQTGTKRFIYYDNILLADPSVEIIQQAQSVEIEQISLNQISLDYSSQPDSSAENVDNFLIYERDDSSMIYPVETISLEGSNAIITTSVQLPNGIPLEMSITNVSNILNPTIKKINPLYTIKELSITKPTIWSQEESPIYLYNNLVVFSELVVEAGVEVRINKDKSIYAIYGGYVDFQGASDSRIVFTSYSNDSSEDDTWTEIYLDLQGDNDSYIAYTDIKNCNDALWIDSLSTVTISDLRITNAKNRGLYSYYGDITADYLLVNQCGGQGIGGVILNGGDYSFNHASIAYNENLDFSAENVANLSISNSIIYDTYNIDANSSSISYSLFPDLLSGPGNISGNPLLASESDLSPTLDSPVINAGDYLADNDPDNTISDIGYHYYHYPNNFTLEINESSRPKTLQLSNSSIGNYDSVEWDLDNDGVWESSGDSVEFAIGSEGTFSYKMRLNKDSWTQSIEKEDIVSSAFNRIYSDIETTITIDSENLYLDWQENTDRDYFFIYKGIDTHDFELLSIEQGLSFQEDLPLENKVFYHVIAVEQDLQVNE